MEISSGLQRETRFYGSPWPYHERPFTEQNSSGKDVVIGAGKTQPDLIRIMYGANRIAMIDGNYGFLKRDNKIRKYDPGKEDKFVFKNMASVKIFDENARELTTLLTNWWRKMELPTMHDPSRNVDLPDSEKFADMIMDPDSIEHEKFAKDRAFRNSVQFIVANIDILKKANIVRNITAGWHIVSYKGRDSEDLSYFKPALEAHRIAILRIVKSDRYQQVLSKLWADAGDPILTNPGFPFFNADVDKEGNPVTRIKTVELFKGLAHEAGYDWDAVLNLVSKRSAKTGWQGAPFVVAPLRRLQPNYAKWQHQFTITPSGLISAYDVQGMNAQRVAWMVPYVYNLLLTPFQVHAKAIRIVLPGLYHDGEAKRERVKWMRDAANKQELFMAEADYSNYDRFIPIDIVRRIVDVLADSFPDGHAEYWKRAAMYLHDDAHLVWPDYLEDGTGIGWLFKPGKLGLMSGVKVTSEMGTLVNSVVNTQALMNCEGWSVEQTADYLCTYLTAKPGSVYERVNIQSDDTLIIAKSPTALVRQMRAFKDAAKRAGLKNSVEIGDRFLMRHMQDSSDKPVPARVFQNTYSNESPPDNELVFLSGLAARTDGLMGFRSVDAFGQGHFSDMTAVEFAFTRRMLMMLQKSIKHSAKPSRTAISLLDELLSINSSMTVEEGDVTIIKPEQQTSRSVFARLDTLRDGIVAALAEYQLKLAANDERAELLQNSWLYDLIKDRHVPSSSLLLDQLLSLDHSGDMAKTISMIANKEHTFFLYAMDTIGIKVK